MYSAEPVLALATRATVEAERVATAALAGAIVERFGELSKLQRATAAEIAQVDGVDGTLATAVKETLDRITETSILDQYA